MSIPLDDLRIAMTITGYASLTIALEMNDVEKVQAQLTQAKKFFKKCITPDIYEAAYELIEERKRDTEK